ncbi:shikimate dehydrogenase family protein [Streptomyces olivaceus]|uniref:shikimate dehydrogenase family protein n=1 Tax=Streptomyces olivaceus TaxID=47716 RepID=UPI001CCE75C2|nr:shikimate dehydrogenase [Streptomyces olivaceus]MBZ6285791.1 shikimate dehydrogenase [Streptomyces olivaceus]
MSHSAGGPQGITGRTRLFAVLGDPVRQVRAPEMLNPVFAELGLDAVLVPVHAPVARLSEVVRGLQWTGNVDGLLVTVPHKAAARDFAEVHSEAVRLAGSTNALRRDPDGRWYAENFDGTGFVAGLVAAGHPPAGKRVTLVGAGGAGGAIAAALVLAGVARLNLVDVDRARVRTVLDRLSGIAGGRLHEGTPPAGDTADVMVNATPLGLRTDDPLPFDPTRLAPGTVVADIIMSPRETRLLRTAASHGLPVHHGDHMLTHQLRLYRDFFGLYRRQDGEQPA